MIGPEAGERGDALSARSVSLLVGLGAAVRLALLLRGAGLSGDEAAIAVNALSIRHGEFPVYYAGQSFMGAAGDAYLTGLAYFVLGVAPATLELVALLLAVAWTALVVRFVWEAWGARAAGFAALWLAIPPELVLWWSQEARPHYQLPLVLGVLELLVARRVPGSSPPAAARRLAVLGLLVGLGYWTNFLSIVYLPAVVLRLALGGYRPRSLAECALPALGFAFGAAPHLLYTLHRGSPVAPFDIGAGAAGILARLPSLAQAWPVLLGIPTHVGVRAAALLAVGLTLLYLVLAAAAVWASRGRPRAWGADLAALGAVIAVNVGALVVSRYGDLLWPRVFYLSPVWTALPGIAALGLTVLPGRWASALVALTFLGTHAAGLAGGLLRGDPPLPALILVERAPLRVQRAAAEALVRDGAVRVYETGHGRRDVIAVSAERVIVSNSYEEAVPRYARAVDGAPPVTVAWWVNRPAPALEQSLAALGAGFEYRAYAPLGGVYAHFDVAPRPVRELDPETLRVTASESALRAAWVLDRDAATSWRTEGAMRGGEWLEIDLGDVRPLAMVRWLPRVYQEAPGGIVVEASVDRRVWRRLLDVPAYAGPLYWSAGRPMGRVRSGRVELRVPPTLARHVRITQTGSSSRWPWTVTELFVYIADPSAPAEPVAWVEGAALGAAVRKTGIQRLYADHGWGSTVALAEPTLRVLPANLHLDAYGWDGPRANLVPPVRWDPGAGALLEPVDAEGFARVASELGRPFVLETVGGLRLFRAAPATPGPGRPLAPGDLAVSASVHPERAGLAVDGNPETRWATARPQAPGDWLRVDLSAAAPVRAVRIWTRTPLDWPRGLTLEGSPDGRDWRPLAARVSTEGELRWGGIALLRNGVEAVRLDFPPTTLRALRLTLTRGDPVYDWSVNELAVFGD